MKWIFVCQFAAVLLVGTCFADDSADVLEVVERYHSAVSYPNPVEIDPEIFTEDIRAFWSGGDILSGRDDVVEGLKKAVEQVKGLFESLKLEARDEKVSVNGDTALVTGLLDFKGKLKRDGRPYTRVVRFTFVLERSDGKWRISHEHSSVLPRIEKATSGK